MFRHDVLSFTKSFALTRLSLALVFVGVLGICGWAASGPDIVISQKGRMFNPGSVSLAKGEALVIVNDDGDLLHHAYVESDDFNYDSGDQQPGSRARIVFPSSGDYKVLCGIHPKMKLLVHVR